VIAIEDKVINLERRLNKMNELIQFKLDEEGRMKKMI
jgi:hypothetical protein